MKKALTIALAAVFIMTLAVSVFAQDMTHDANYEMDGMIDIEKQVGHLCNTGAELKQTIYGQGEMSKAMDTVQVAGKITVDDKQDWVTAEDAVFNLTVTSVIELCAPPKHEYTTTLYLPVYEEEEDDDEVDRRTLVFDAECGDWMVAQSGGFGLTIDDWDISKVVDGAVIDFRFDALFIPDRFTIEYDGEIVLETGWRGDASYDGDPLYPGGIEGPGAGQVDEVITKKPGVDELTVTVEGVDMGTLWLYWLRCRIPSVGPECFDPFVIALDEPGGDPVSQVEPNDGFDVLWRITNNGPDEDTQDWTTNMELYDETGQEKVPPSRYTESRTLASGESHGMRFPVRSDPDFWPRTTYEDGDYFIFRTINECGEEATWRVDVTELP